MKTFNEFNKMRYDLYVDLDGVLADFDAGIYRLFNKYPEQLPRHPFTHVIKGGHSEGFFLNLPKMGDADTLWSHVKKYDPVILTAHGGQLETAAEEKRQWVKKHFGDVKVITVEKGRDKHKVVSTLSNSILIDDRLKAIDPWRNAGGIGILHKTAQGSISELTRILRNNT